MKIENIYVRIEDDIGFPGHPFAIGLILKEVTAETTDQTWQKKFIEDAELVHKRAEIKGLSAFFNYTDKKRNILIEDTIGKDDLKAFVRYATEQCASGQGNRMVLHPLNVMLLLVLNKLPKKNNAPEINAVLAIGNSLNKNGEKSFLGFNIEMEQIPIAMKLLEYMGMYSKFQRGVLMDYQKEKPTSEEREKYGRLYRDFVGAARKKESKALEEKQKALAAMEETLAVNAIERMRRAERLEMSFKEKAEDSKKKMDEKVKIMEGQKKSALSSVKSFFGSSSAKEKLKKAKDDVEKYKEELLKDQEEKMIHEREAVNKEIKEMFSEDDVRAEMPENVERFRFAFEISKFAVSVAQGQADNVSVKMCELSVEGINVSFPSP